MYEKRQFITIPRDFIEWEWWTDRNAIRLFLYCVLTAETDDLKWHGTTLRRGSFASSLCRISEGTGMSVQEVRTSMMKLIESGYLTKESKMNRTIISVNDFDMYVRCVNVTEGSV